MNERLLSGIFAMFLLGCAGKHSPAVPPAADAGDDAGQSDSGPSDAGQLGGADAGLSDAGLGGSSSFAIALPDRIEVGIDDLTVIALLVVGATGPVTFSATGLPAFATLNGSNIRVAAGPTDPPGDTRVDVTAADGTNTTTASFVLGVVDAAPTLDGGLQINDLVVSEAVGGAAPSPRQRPLASASSLEVDGPGISIQGSALDDEGDAVELVVELRAAGESLTGTPTQTSGLGAVPGKLVVNLADLSIDTHYALAAWVRDSHGADGPRVEIDDLVRRNLPPYFGRYHHDSQLCAQPTTAAAATIKCAGDPSLDTGFLDSDGDNVEVLVEVQPDGQAFTGLVRRDVATSCPRWFCERHPEHRRGRGFHLRFGGRRRPVLRQDTERRARQRLGG